MGRLLLEGLISEVQDGEGDVLAVAGISISRTLESCAGRCVTARYHVSSKPMSLQEADDQFIKVVHGAVDADVDHRYSEITGYLWTDEHGKIGGHDLVDELSVDRGKYAAVEIVIHEVDMDSAA